MAYEATEAVAQALPPTPAGAQLALALALSLSLTRVSTLAGKSTSSMRMPSASSILPLEMSSTPCSRKEVTKPLAK